MSHILIRERERERDRDRDRDWDERSSTFRDPARGTLMTVKRYRIPPPDDDPKIDRLALYERDRDRRSDYGGRDSRSVEETRIIRRERSPSPEPERRVERDIRIERVERERDPEPERRYEKDIRIERFEREREPEPRRFEREIRYERDVEPLPVRRDPYELEKYSRSTEYFRTPDPPQPIIIRQAPQQIIIQEAPRAPIVIAAPQKEESEYQLIQRAEVSEDRQVARREPQHEEDYYYERRTREVQGAERDDDVHEERYVRRREVSPGDSISQHERDYSSDEDMVYIKKEVRETYGRDGSPHHKRHLAEGAIAGIGAAELLRHHRKEEGKDSSSRGSRVGKDIGAAALGAVAAQGISRAKSHHREKSRVRHGSRSRSRERDRKGRRKHRYSRSRSRSHSRIRQLAGLGLGAAALAAAVGYANRNKNNNSKDDRRSRSRTRRHSISAAVPEDDARNPAHRKKKIAQAGLATAAVAGLVERARSKSRSRGKSRSKSRVRQGLEVAGAGLGGAALAGLYEKNQAKKADKEEESGRRERTRRRGSRSRSRSVPYDGYRDAAASDPGLIEYGDQPVYSTGGVPDFYNRPASQAGFYGAPSEAMVPVLAAGPRNNESRSRDRRREVSSSGSDSGKRRRHRHKKDESRSHSRTRDLATAGLAAGAAGIAVSQHEKRKQRRKEEKRERRRQEAEQEHAREPREPRDPRDEYAPHAQYPPISSPPPGAPPAGYAQPQENYYPSTNSFPPPPNPAYLSSQNYNPVQPGPQPPAQIHPDYSYSPPAGYPPPPGASYEPQAANPYLAPENRTRRADENVSAEPFVNNTAARGFPLVPKLDAEEGLNSQPVPPHLKSQPRAYSQPPPVSKSVQFDLNPQSFSSDSLDPVPTSPENSPKSHRKPSGIRPRSYSNSNHNRVSAPAPTENSRSRRYNHRHHTAHHNTSRSPSPALSDATLDLPPRFDKYGRPIAQTGGDPLADAVEGLLAGTGVAGKFLGKLAAGLGGR